MKYRKKPVVIEAIQWTGLNLEEVIAFTGNSIAIENLVNVADERIVEKFPVDIHIKTLEGVMHVSKYDYIIKGVNGEFYPCKPDIFEKTYECIE